LERHFEAVESEFNSIWLIEVVVYSELHRTLGVIVRQNTARKLRAACGAGAVTCTRNALRKGIHLPPQHAATAGWLQRDEEGNAGK
jgi:hypothetical protein